MSLKRKFDTWFAELRDSIADYGYYINFKQVYENLENTAPELKKMSKLIGSKNIESEFIALINKNPEVLSCIPLLLATRETQIPACNIVYDFKNPNLSAKQYAVFMQETGLFDLLQNPLVGGTLINCAIGIEIGLNANARKNRSGHLMENLVQKHIERAGFIKDETYFKEMNACEIEERFGIDLGALTNQGQTEKRFDFVIYTPDMIYGVESNFYQSTGSKINETARGYMSLASKAEMIPGFTFVWITDGKGWKKTKSALKTAYNTIEHLYNIADLENDIINKMTQ